MASSSSSSSISSSFRLFFTAKLPTIRATTATTKNLRFLRPITFDRVATNPTPLKASPQPPSSSSVSSLQSVEELPPKLREIVNLFQSVREPKAKYEQLLFYGKNLKPLSDSFKTKTNKVEGCVSQVWVRAYLDSERNVVFEADSDSVLTKGLAALLVNGLSGRPAEEILRVSPDFAVLLGLQQSLTPSRNNGFLNMLKLMQKKALELIMETESSKDSESSSLRENLSSVSENSINFESNSDESLSLREKFSSVGEDSIRFHSNSEESSSLREKFSSVSENSISIESNYDESSSHEEKLSSLGNRGKRIWEKLMKELSPVELEVDDVSYQHAGHAGARGSGDGETHFEVRVVSKEFEGKSLVKRHRLVYGLLKEELESGLHALSIVAKTPEEVS